MKINLGRKTRVVLVLGIVFAISFVVLVVSSLVAPPPAGSAIKCSPVIAQTNLSVFGDLMKKLTSDYLISQAKSFALSQIKLEYLQGPFGEMLMSGLTNSLDISGKIEGVMNAGFNSELSVISKEMSPDALMTSINNSASQSLETALKGLNDMPRRLAEQTVDSYTNQFLEKSGFNSYKAAAQQYQQQMSSFMSTATDTSKKFLDLGQTLDVAGFVENGATSGLGAVVNTRTITNELNNFVANGIQDTKLVWGSDVGVQVETGFTNLNETYLRRQLENLREVKGVASLTDQKINEIIASTNGKSLNAVSSYLNNTASSLTNQANKATTYAQNTISNTIGKVEQTLQRAMSIEKQSDTVASAVSENVKKSVQSALEAGEWKSVAVEPKPLPLPFARSVQSALDNGTWTSTQTSTGANPSGKMQDALNKGSWTSTQTSYSNPAQAMQNALNKGTWTSTQTSYSNSAPNSSNSMQDALNKGTWTSTQSGYSNSSANPSGSMQQALNAGTWTSTQVDQANMQNAEDTKKLAVFLGGDGKKHSAVVKTNVKYFLIAKESGDLARNILQKIKTYNVTAIDKTTDDAAWKDAARFQYYTLMLQNQQMKLLAARAMAIGMSLKALDDDLASFIEKTGLPANF